MPNIKRVKSIGDKTKIEYLESKLAEAYAVIDYLAMMTDVEIPVEEVDDNE